MWYKGEAEDAECGDGDEAGEQYAALLLTDYALYLLHQVRGRSRAQQRYESPAAQPAT